MAMGAGAVFAGYTIQGLLASDATGDTYVARHPASSRLDVLKIFPPTLTADAGFRQRFERDAHAAAALRHPNIVGLHDRGEFDGRLWITMDYVDGIDAGRLLRERHPSGMAARDVLEIVTVVADALDHGHRHGMLHRDVAPGNILVTNPGAGPRRILLSGFGITRNGGSESYAAPEKLMGGALDGRADQYALAATAFHLLTGGAPHPDARTAAVLAPLNPVLSKAMNADPAQRFPRCADFARALGASVDAAAAQWHPAPPWPPPYPAAGPARKRNVLVSVLVPLLLTMLLLGAVAFAGTQVLRAPRASTAAPQWQPYVDYAKQFAVWLISMSPRSADSDIQRILDGSTGEFHDEFAKNRDGFTKTLVGANVSTQGNVTGAALDSMSGPQAQVLVAATATVTDSKGATQEPRSWRLELRVEKAGDAYKVSKVEFVT